MAKQLINQQRIGIYGGTFDPVHNAHLMVARLAREAAGLGRVIFMPSGTPPHKPAQELTDAKHRLEMVQLAIAGQQGYEVSDLEIATPGVDYTVDTLRMLKSANPAAKLYFIIGGDSLMYLDQWYDPQGLLESAAFVTVFRPDSPMEDLERKRREILARYGGEILLVECPGMDISSTAIRQMAAAGEDVSAFVPPAVAHYIAQNKLYLERL